MSKQQSMFQKVQLFNLTSGAETYDNYKKIILRIKIIRFKMFFN